MNPPELRARILAEWAMGRFASEIASEFGLTESKVNGIVRHGPEAWQARADHYRNKAARDKPKYRSLDSLDREVRVLGLWASGESASDIGAKLDVSRNAIIGIIHRSRGAEAEEAKRSHFVLIEHTNAPRARKRLHPKPASAAPSISSKADAKLKRVLSPQELAARREQQAAAGRSAIAKVELTLIDNPAFVARVEPEPDVYAHLRSDKGYRDAVAALTR